VPLLATARKASFALPPCCLVGSSAPTFGLASDTGTKKIFTRNFADPRGLLRGWPVSDAEVHKKVVLRADLPTPIGSRMTFLNSDYVNEK
jgi:hypothetical protein